MTGRAGRPGFDTSGVAVIMTSVEDKEYYEKRDMDIVESVLPGQLVEGNFIQSFQP
jgi:replicative superfamily II helicase